MPFDFQKALAQWRSKLHGTGKLEDGQVEELESHLIDLYDHFCSKEMSKEEAFEHAVSKIGYKEQIANEYKMASLTNEKPVWQILMPDFVIHYLKISSRVLLKDKAYSLINISGLALGLACTIFISYFVSFHLSVDQQYRESGIYRVVNVRESETGTYTSSSGPVPLAGTLKTDFPEVKESVRIWGSGPILSVNDQLFYEENFIYADANFLEFFDLPLIQGNKKTALSSPNTIAITESVANRYFPGHQAVGQTIRYDGYPGGQGELTVTAVLADLPENTHLKFDYVASLVGMDREAGNWGSFKPLWSYVKLQESASKNDLTSKFPAFIDNYVPNRRLGLIDFRFDLEPIVDIHLGSDADGAMKPSMNPTLLWTLGITALVILVLSCVNFINLTMAKSFQRFHEVGVRKVFGSQVSQIRMRFFVDGVITVGISILVGFSIVWITYPSFEHWSDIPFSLTYLMANPLFIYGIAASLSLCIVSTLIPTLKLSGINPVKAFAVKKTHGKTYLSNAFVILQFVISSVLLISALLIKDQLDYIKNRELGVHKTDIVAIQRPPLGEAFENALNNNANILGWGYSQLLPLNEMNYDGRSIRRPGDETPYWALSSFINPGFINTYGIKIVAGRNLSDKIASDSVGYLINETAVRSYGFKDAQDAIGQTLTWSGSWDGRIVGVVQDFNMRSLHEEIPPCIFLRNRRHLWHSNFLSVKINPGETSRTLAFLKDEFYRQAPERPFDYFFVSDSFEQIHESDLRTGELSQLFSLIAVFIACLGLFGLTNLELAKRVKEIGIRKVLGSTVFQIFTLLGRSYFLKVTVAFAIAMPIAFMLIEKWLKNYAYHSGIDWRTFVVSIFLLVIITLMAIGWKTLRASRENPAELLRYE